MKNFLTVLAVGASISPAAATFGFGGNKWHNADKFTCPGNSDNKCDDKFKGGLDWKDLLPGKFDFYNGFDFNGWTCEDEGGFKNIVGEAGVDLDTAPSFSCGPLSGVDRFSLKEFEVDVEVDGRFEFHYGLPDGSVCKQSHDCRKGKNTIKNKQCGGATDFKITFPDQPNKQKEKCKVKIPNFDFDCDDNTPPPPPPPTTSEPQPEPTTEPEPEPTPEPETTTSEAPETDSTPEPETTTSEAPVTDSTPQPETTTSEAPETDSTPQPETTTSEAPVTDSTPASTPVSTPGQSTPVETPVETPSETPVETPSETPVETPSETPATSSEELPGTTGPVSTPAVETPTAPATTSAPETTVKTTVYDTTSTVFTTEIKTITDCGPEKPECGGQEGSTVVVTQTVPVTTTVCPVTETITGPVESETSSPDEPEGELPCPEVVPKCLNTWLHLVAQCKDNLDASCFCPSKEFVKETYECIYAFGETDDIISEAISFFQGLCAPHIPQNPGIVTDIDTITDHLTVTGTPTVTSVPYTTVVITTVVTEPCVTDGVTISESSTIKTISTEVTVPAVPVPTPTEPAVETTVAVPTGGDEVVPPTATGVVPPFPTGPPATLTTSNPVGTIPPPPPPSSTGEVPVGSATRAKAGAMGLVVAAFIALL